MNWYFKNLLCGLKYALCLPCDVKSFKISWHALFAIAATMILTHWFIDMVILGQTGDQDDTGWIYFHSGLLTFTLLGFYGIATIHHRHSEIVTFMVMFYNSFLFIFIPYLILDAYSPDWYSGDIYQAIENLSLIWTFLITFRLIGAVLYTKIEKQIIGALIAVGAIYCLNTQIYLGHFYYDYGYNEESEPTPFEQLTGEELFAMQASLMEQSLAQIKPSQKGITDLYGISFGSYGYQDVFMRESRYAAERMQEILKMDKGVVTLINNPDAAFENPLANATNLGSSLKHIAQNMQTDEDIVMIYITSHGGPEDGISVNLKRQFTMRDLSTELFLNLLNESGIKNKIIVISACFSGKFIPVISDDNTLIITSAAENRQSYGCSDEADLTYFAQAYLKEALFETTDLEKAFYIAKEAVENREKKEDLKSPSNPQIFIGKNIKAIMNSYKSVTISSENESISTTDE